MTNTGTLLGTLAARHDLTTPIRVAAVLFVSALTATAAQISIPLPFTPVPFTLQPMVVLLGGAALGSRLGMASQVLYLAAGIAGLPVFAASAVLPQGFLRLLGPTGGYLISYPFAAFLTGRLAERGLRSPLPDVGDCHDQRPCGRVCVWRLVARVLRTACSTRSRRRAAHRPLSVRAGRHHQGSARGHDPASRLAFRSGSWRFTTWSRRSTT